MPEMPFLHLTIPRKFFFGFDKQPQMCSPSCPLWSFARKPLLFVFLKCLGDISPVVPIWIYPSGLLSWLSPFFSWRIHVSLISAFQMPSRVPGTTGGGWVKTTQWTADGRKPRIKIRLISGTTWWVYTKQFEFLKKHVTNRSKWFNKIMLCILVEKVLLQIYKV